MIGPLSGCTVLKMETLHNPAISKTCHIEYSTEDLTISRAFAEKVFGWTFREFSEEMVVFGTGDEHIGGFMKGRRPHNRMSPGVSYEVSDLDATLQLALELGAAVGDQKRPVPGVGFYASVIAPDGNEFGMVEFSPSR